MQTLKVIEQELPYEINEELKLLRTNIQFSCNDKRVILMTSSFSGEGKSTLSLDLARAFSELDKKTLYIDADMRKSQILSRFEAADIKYGLSHYLSGQCALNDMICKTDIDGLCVIASVQVPPNPAELIAGPRFKQLIDACRKYTEKTHRRITFEYAVTKDVNDRDKDIEELTSLLKGMLCHVNLIPLNPIEEGGLKSPGRRRAEEIAEMLEKAGIPATVRRTLGSDIQASCGQLRLSAQAGTNTENQ